MKLQVCNTSTTKTYTLTNVAPAKPYLVVSNSYLPLTTATLNGVKFKVQSGNSTYRAMEWGSVSTKSTYTSTSTAIGNLSSTSIQTYTQATTSQGASTSTGYGYGVPYNTYTGSIINMYRSYRSCEYYWQYTSRKTYRTYNSKGNVTTVSNTKITNLVLPSSSAISDLYTAMENSNNILMTINTGLTAFLSNVISSTLSSYLFSNNTRTNTYSKTGTITTSITSIGVSSLTFSAKQTYRSSSITGGVTVNTFRATGYHTRSATRAEGSPYRGSMSFWYYSTIDFYLFLNRYTQQKTFVVNTTSTLNGYKGVSSKSTSTPGYV